MKLNKKMFDLGTTILASKEKNPNAIAIAGIDYNYTYHEWFKKIDTLSGSLKYLGLKKQEKVITLLQNNFEASTIHWACQLNNLIVVPLNWRMKSEEIDFCISNSEASCIFFQEESMDGVELSLEAKKIKQIFVGGNNHKILNISELIKNGNPGNHPEGKSDSYSIILYTSGTTGKPKGVPRTHLAERSAALAHVAQNMYKNGEITLGVMPLYHTMGIRSLISMSLINGTFITQPKFSSLEAIKLINKFKITSLYLVPTLFHELIEDKSFTNNKVKSCKKLGFAGAPMNNGLIKKVMKAFKPIQLVNHYGSSEVYTFTVDQNADKKPGSAGKAGINQRIRVVEIGSKNPQKIVKKNIEGEIIASLKSEESFSGYLKRPDANKKSIIKNWYFTNDIGYIDNNGDLFVTGRVDDMIITGGENVSPIEIENLLSLNKNVLEVVVVGLPDEKWGQRICGFIKRDGNIEFGNLDNHCKESGIANFKRPKEYIFVKEIPKSPTGKILRRKLLAGEYDLDR